MRYTKKTVILMLAAVLLFSVLFADCGYRPIELEPEKTPELFVSGETSSEPETTPEPAGKTFTVTYTLKGETIAEETVPEGSSPAHVPTMWEDRGILRWNNANGTETDVWSASINADTVYEAVTGPALKNNGGYFAAESDGLFHPLNKFTRSDAVRVVYNLLAQKPTGETFLKDVTTRARCYQAATSLVTAGYISLDEQGRFYPDVAINREDLTALLSRLFSAGAVQSALSDMREYLTRGQAAMIINGLLELEEVEDKPYFPDVSPDMEEFSAVECAGIAGTLSWVNGERAQPGFVNLDGYLYCVGDDGYFLRDTMKGTLYFDITGQYTSGDEAVDKYVADIIDAQTKSTMSREDMLRTLYLYVRDHYLYLKRSLYDVGETGWELKETLVMFQTGKGNCYNFSGAFWALARGIGYDAVCYSGLVGRGRDPHSWVEIEFDGVPYIFDVETEMSQRLQDDYISNLYKMTYEQGKYWSYAWEPYDDEPTQ